MITEEQLQKVREPIPFTPTKRLKRDDVLYVTEEDIPHPLYGYARSHKEYSVIDLRGYRKGYEPRLEISGIYTPNPEDIFRLQTGKLPPYQPTTTGDKLLAEMRRLGVHKAFRIGKPEVRSSEKTEEWKLREAIADTAYGLAHGVKEEDIRKHLTRNPGAKYWFEPVDVDYILRGAKREVVEAKLESVIEYDYRYSLEELREMARQEGLSSSGSKKEIAARLIARGIK